jgi:hypothetical protein
MQITRKSIISGITRTREIPVDFHDYAVWQSGTASIQDVLHYLSDSDREFLLSGITDDEWNSLFSEELES